MKADLTEQAAQARSDLLVIASKLEKTYKMPVLAEQLREIAESLVRRD